MLFLSVTKVVFIYADTQIDLTFINTPHDRHSQQTERTSPLTVRTPFNRTCLHFRFDIFDLSTL